MWALPVAKGLEAYGSLKQGDNASDAMESQARVTQNQALRDEEAQRRETRAGLGSMAAAFAQAGGGIDEGVLRQSAIRGELDALNTRYAGMQRAAALFSNARSTRKQSKLLAGAQILSGAAQTWAARKLPSPT